MFDKFKHVWQQFTNRVDGNLARDESPDFNELDKTREKLAKLRFKNNRSTTTSNLDLESVRKRITQEVEMDNCITVRKRDSQAISKWFRPQEITDSGSFDTSALHRRIEEMRRAEVEVDPLELDSFPQMEDTFMAFSKPEEDLFDDEERITLSGINYRVDPLEELEEEFSLPGIPMFQEDCQVESSDLDIETDADRLASRVLEESQAINFAPEQSQSEDSIGVKNPTKEILSALEMRLSQDRVNKNFWVDSGN